MIRCAILACFVTLPGWQSPAMAQVPVEEAVSSHADSRYDVVEEAPAELPPLTVTGERTRSAVQREMDAVQIQAFRLFNELNPEDDYDMDCRRERPRGSQFVHRVCKSRFHREADSQASTEFLERLNVGMNVYRVDRTEIDRAYDHQRELMKSLANTNPEYRELLERHYALRQEFEAKGGVVRHGAGSN